MQTFTWDIWMTCRWEEEWKKFNKIWPRSLAWRLPWVFDLTVASDNTIQKQNGQRRHSWTFSEWTMTRYFCLGPQYSRAERCRAYCRLQNHSDVLDQAIQDIVGLHAQSAMILLRS